MNENLNLVEILKDCPQGTKLYSPLFGEVRFRYIREGYVFPIVLSYDYKGNITSTCFTKDGRYVDSANGECLLFPSKEQRDWSKFKVSKPKFDPHTLQPFDKVLTRESPDARWYGDFVSMPPDISDSVPYIISDREYDMVIPYNEDTKHLIGTTEDAPEYYRYWEE